VPTRAKPTPTPSILASLHNQILFKATKDPDYLLVEPDLWVMKPDGTNRRNLGPFADYKAQFEALYAGYARSPDGRFVITVNGEGQLVMSQPSNPAWGPLQLTDGGLNYDPQWSPDGGSIALVRNKGVNADNIWVMQTDGLKQVNLTPNTWEWDKHPAWSPDSQRIVWWSNRNGMAQIYIMDRLGRDPTNISQSQLNEWDPIWVR
jgi:TolB protein